MNAIRILLIESHEKDCGDIARDLTMAGHAVVSVTDPGILAYVDEFINVDLILVDVGADPSSAESFLRLMDDRRTAHRMLGVACRRGWHRLRPALAGVEDRILLKPVDAEALDAAFARFERKAHL